MSKQIEERVVSLQFNNKAFEQNVSQSMSTLDKLKQKLSFKGVAKGFDDVSNAAKNVNLNGLNSQVGTLKASFSALDVMAVTALSNITNSAINAGKNLAKSFTIDPITDGFREYETQLNSVQTILANTQHKGTTLNQVNAALDELNTYADQTIYNFTEMTRNIGTFTAAGVDLDKSVTSIKGIANLAALSGSNAQQASTAMYQLSQALAAGKVSLMDWNSVVNAGMGGQVFQDALVRTADQMGMNASKLVKDYGSFRESLTEGAWLTADVLTETLTQLSGAYSEADLIAQGYTEKQAKDIVKMAETAKAAATEVKTFTQLLDTTKEAIGSGWAQTWEIVFGDFGESKELWTKASDNINNFVNSVSEARNKMLTGGLSSGWKQLLSEGIVDEEGYKEQITSVAKEHGIAVDKMIKDSGSFEESLKKGWLTGDILTESLDKMTKKMSGMSEKQLKAAGYTTEQVKQMKELNEAVKKGSINMDDFAKKLTINSGRENVIQGITNILTTLGNAIKPIHEAFRDIFPATTGDQLYSFTEKFKSLTEQFTITAETADKIKRTFKGVFSIFDLLGKAVKTVLSPIGTFVGSGGLGGMLDIVLTFTSTIGDFFTTINESTGVGNFFSGLSEGLSTVSEGMSKFIKSIAGGFGGIKGIFSGISNVVSYVGDTISNIFSWLTDNISGGDVAAGLAGGGIFLLLKNVAGLFGKIKDIIDGFFGEGSGGGLSDLVDNFSSVLEGVHGSLEAFTSGIKVASLVGIAVAIGILSSSLRTMSELEPESIVRSLVAMGIMFTALNVSFRSLTKTLSKNGSRGVIKSSIALIGLATALSIMASAMKKISDLDMDQIGRSLAALGVGLAELSIAMRILSKAKGSIRNSIALIILAKACSVLGDALKKFTDMSWDEIGRGLSAMGGALLELSVSLAILSKVGGFGSIFGATGILIAVQSLGTMADSLKKFANMSWDEIGRGLAAMGGALGELTVCLAILSKVGGFGSLLGATSILIAVQSLDEISENLKKLGLLQWEEIGKGLSAMGGALLELSLVVGLLGKLTGFSGILGATSILIAVQSLGEISENLKKLGSLQWDEIGRGLAAMGGALGELSLITGLLGKLTGFSGLVGAGTILLAVQGLDQLADGLNKFGTMSWDEIGRGLAAMGGALTEVALASGLTGALTNIAGLVGAGTITLAVQGLDQLANALIKFGNMSWDEIGRGLSAMGGALGETALGSLINTFSGFGADAIAKVAGPLGDLAASVQKWANVKVPDGLGEQLAALAPGIMSFNFSGWGADAVASLAGPLGILAGSVQKWANVVVPDGLGEQLKSLAPGISAFNFAGWGADAIAALATPLGNLATSVKAWGSVVVPENMKETLQSLASGIKAFNFAGWAANDISDLVEPLKNLAGSVKAWNGVIIPEGMGSRLSSLASGIKAFNLGFFDGDFDVKEAIGPIKDLAGAVAAWKDVPINESMGASLTSLSNSLKTFTNIDSEVIASSSNAIRDIGKAATDISTIDFASVASSLNSFVTALSNIKVSTAAFSDIGASLVLSLVNSINSNSHLAQSAGATIVQRVSTGIVSNLGSLTTTASRIIQTILTAINSKASSFVTAGKKLMTNLGTGIDNNKSSITKSISSLLSSCTSKMRSYYSSFRSAGSYLVQGFASGISANTWRAEAEAEAMAAAADTAARKRLKVKSPSRVFKEIGGYVPQGFAQGISMFGRVVKQAAEGMGNTAISGTERAMNMISAAINSDIDIQPKIRPVVDLSDIRAGSKTINSLFSQSPNLDLAANVSGLSASISAHQNGGNDDVVSELRDLKRAMKNTRGDTYQINGITYDDGSNVADAVKTLVRAARVERRK